MEIKEDFFTICGNNRKKRMFGTLFVSQLSNKKNPFLNFGMDFI
jgi:hypothetical protein